MRRALLILAACAMGCSQGGGVTDLLPGGVWEFAGGSSTWPALSGSCARAQGSECSFEVPGPWHTLSANYLIRSERQDATGKTVTAVYEVEGDGELVGSDGPGDPAFVVLHVESDTGDRWWHGGSRKRLESSGVLTAPLRWEEWTGVYGKTDQAAFERDVRHLAAVGVTFGGRDAYGHGVSCQHGSARVSIVSYSLSGGGGAGAWADAPPLTGTGPIARTTLSGWESVAH